MSPRATCLMVQGTGSGAGKSTLVAALCRIFRRAGYSVAPFKSQNMSLNASVTAEGAEISRAQAAQAEAAGIEATADMNPILLKPETDRRAQVVVRGRVRGSMGYREYRRLKPELLPLVAESLGRLRARHDVVVIEGAGSPAEINLMKNEIVNMRIAALAGAPVLLVGDIERGGVFAALVGTLDLLPARDRERVRGFVINKFRGDLSLLRGGVRYLEGRTGVPVLGVVPMLDRTMVPAEDSLDLEDLPGGDGRPVVDIVVVRLRHLSNFDEFEPLAREPGVRLRFSRRPGDIDEADLVIVPGTKCTIPDLEDLRQGRLDRAILDRARRGGPILGVCGGYQMLGRELRDPDRLESRVPRGPGLGLLPIVTTFERRKRTEQVHARIATAAGVFATAGGMEVRGYEIHGGITEASPPAPLEILRRGAGAEACLDGAFDASRLVAGTYVHGLFGNPPLRRAVLDLLAQRRGRVPDPRWGGPPAGDRYDLLARAVGRALDLPAIGALVDRPLRRGARLR